MDGSFIKALEGVFQRQSLVTARAPDGSHLVLVPAGSEVKSLPHSEVPLLRIIQKPTFEEAQSFCSYVSTFKTAATRLFAADGTVMAIIDYHVPGEPARLAHVVTFKPRLSAEWQRWTSAGTMPQAAFAEFVEENRRDITEPSAAMLLDIVTKFKATKKQDYDSVVYQPNGDVTIAWSDKTEMAGKPGVAVPSEIKIGIPVYFKGERYAIPVFMRYRLADGKLSFSLKLDRADYVLDDAFDNVTKAIGEAVHIEVYHGKP